MMTYIVAIPSKASVNLGFWLLSFSHAVCEAFFARMKYEALYRQTYSSVEEIDEEVKKYIDYYNNRRPHRRLNFKSPAEVEAAYYESLKA